MRHPFAPLAVTLLLAAGSALSGSAAAAPQADGTIDVLTHTPAPVYAGQAVARVRADSARELNAALALAEGLWSEGAGVGRAFDIQVHADRLGALGEAGLAVEVLIPDLQAHADARWARVQGRERLERRRELDQPNQPNQRGGSPHDDAWFANYKQLSEIRAYVDGLAAARPDLASIADVGDTVQGRDIRSITITGPDQPGNAAADRPIILWNGCQHAREWISPMTVTYLASRLIADYDTDPAVKQMVDSVRFVIVPVSNPDGYLYSWSSERYWRKNRRANSFSSFGVDLNRNWGYEWGGAGTSGDTNSDIYRGPSAFSEPETRSLRDLALSMGDDLAAHIDYHSYSQLILWPFGYASNLITPEPDRTFFDDLATDMSDLILSSSGVYYDPIQSWMLYPAAGTAVDWFYGTAGAKSLTIELRPDENDFGGFDPDPSEILPCAQENWLAAQLFVQRTTQRLAFSVAEPVRVPSGEPYTLAFTVSSGVDDYDPSSVELTVSVGSGSPQTVPATQNGTGSYTATLPAGACGDQIAYAIHATTLGGDDVAFPASGSLTVDVLDATLALEDDMETDTGWTVGLPSDTATTGVWERADPQGTDAQPENDHTAGGTDCWVTGASAGGSIGANDIDNGATTLTSPPFDALSGSGEAVIGYWRWFSNNAGSSPGDDTMVVQISGDGSAWTTLETVASNDAAWTHASFVVSDFIAPTTQVRLRFIASDEGPGSIVEAGLDDLTLSFVGCDDAPTADLAEPFGVFNFFDVAAFIDLFNAGDPAADFDGNGSINFFDLDAFLDLFNAGL